MMMTSSVVSRIQLIFIKIRSGQIAIPCRRLYMRSI